MTVRQQITLLCVLALCGLGAGCGGGDSAPPSAEADDLYFRQGKQLVKEGRTQEALAAYLKAIDHRGELSSAESHLEAGVLYLNHSKDPVEAYHHFRLYLSQQPNSRDAPRVRELLNTAKREFLGSLGQTFDNQGGRANLVDQIERLKRENEALNAELTALRGSASAPVMRQTRSPAIIELPQIRTITQEPQPPPLIPVEEQSPITLAPPPPARVEPTAPPSATTAISSPAANPGSRVPPSRSAAQAPPASGPRRHTVVQGDTLFGLTKKYYGAASVAKADAIYEANRDVMKNKGDLRPGMEIKIP
jgi:nucleoid-associated protein YgaU